MKRAILFLLLVAFAAPSYAASYLSSWPSGNWVYAQAITEQDYSMSQHQQQASVSISGPTGYDTAASGFMWGTAYSFAAVPVGAGWYDIWGIGEVFCWFAGAVISTIDSFLNDVYGWSDVCVQKAISSCVVGVTGIVSCWYYPICSWPQCASTMAVYIYGANNQRYLYRKRWRIRSMGVLDCYGSLDVVAQDCTTCSQTQTTGP